MQYHRMTASITHNYPVVDEYKRSKTKTKQSVRPENRSQFYEIVNRQKILDQIRQYCNDEPAITNESSMKKNSQVHYSRLEIERQIP